MVHPFENGSLEAVGLPNTFHIPYLMKDALSDYEGKVDLFFLFANESVLDFYPKFGFRKIEETIF
ncbi:hypothetical protein [Leptospira perolatii]|uniref:hypothetical protein n=1 Tax=Leptospira perolatii TaxID=2023191 RepID=UPI0013FDA030